MSAIPDAPVTVPARPTNVGELYDRIIADQDLREQRGNEDKDARELRGVIRHRSVIAKLEKHAGMLREHDSRITRVERNVFPTGPLWALVFVGALLLAQREMHRTPVLRNGATQEPAQVPVRDSAPP